MKNRAGVIGGAAAAAPRLPRRMRAYEVGAMDTGLALHMTERPVPSPGHGQVLIKVHATGLNARDLWIIRNQFGRKAADHIPLSDNVGRIVAVGAGVNGLAVGDRVTVTHYAHWLEGDWLESYAQYDLGNNVNGFLAEYAIAPAASVVRISDRLSDEQACTLSIAGLTAWRSLAVEARPMPSEIVLTLGTGGVSVFGIQVAKMFGARVIVTSSSDEKLARMKTFGADMTVNYRTLADWPKEVMEITGGHGADIVLNNVGYPELENCFRAVANNARVIHIGASRQQTDMLPLQNFFMKDCSIKGISNGSRRMLADFVTAADVNGLIPLVDRVFPFDQAVEAVHFMEKSSHSGKVVIKIADA